MTEPPFFRGDLCDDGWHAEMCDHLAEGAEMTCNAPSEYRVEWQHNPELDGDSFAISGCCEAHAVYVDRRQVLRMSTHPRKVSA